MKRTVRTLATLGLLVATSFAIPAVANDLWLDYSFQNFHGNGEASYRYTSGSSDEALRIFPSVQSECNEGGCFAARIYYVAGRTQSAGSTNWAPALLVLDQDGNPIADIGENGWLVSPAHLEMINDVAYDPAQGRMYFVGTDYTLAAAIICMNVDTGTLCSGFGIGGGGMTKLRFGDGYNSFGMRLLFDAELGLLVSGNASLPEGDGDYVGVARLSATTGERLSAFSTDGRRVYTNSPRQLTANRMYVNAMALAPTKDSSGRRHLYIGGSYRVNYEVYDSFDGFVLAINGKSGSGISNFGGPGTAWLTVTYEYPNYKNMKDSVTALTVLANSKLAVLGWTEEDYGNSGKYRKLMFARFGSDGTHDPDFCSYRWPFGGGNNACDGVKWNFFVAADSSYAAILERPDNRDPIYFYTSANDINMKQQMALQSSASGNTTHEHRCYYVFCANPLVASIARSAAWDWGRYDRIVFAGSRQRSDSIRWEFTVARVLNDGTIFADTFGGPHSD